MLETILILLLATSFHCRKRWLNYSLSLHVNMHTCILEQKSILKWNLI